MFLIRTFPRNRVSYMEQFKVAVSFFLCPSDEHDIYRKTEENYYWKTRDIIGNEVGERHCLCQLNMGNYSSPSITLSKLPLLRSHDRQAFITVTLKESYTLLRPLKSTDLKNSNSAWDDHYIKHTHKLAILLP